MSLTHLYSISALTSTASIYSIAKWVILSIVADAALLGQVGRAVLDRDREGVVDPVGKTRRTSRGAEEEVGHLRVQV